MQIPGELLDDKKYHHPVTVLGLTKTGCHVAGDGKPIADGTPVNFFIGAVGPIPGKAETGPGERLKINFLRPLDDQIVQHFEAC